MTKVLALALWAKRTPRVGVRETGPGDEERGSGLQHGRRARTALTTQETHQAASARRGGVRISNLGTTRNNADTPRAHDSRDRHEGLRACTGPTRNGALLATAPPEGSGDALRPRRSASEFQAVPAQLLRLLCPTPRSACVFPRFRAPFLSYRDVSPWRLSIQTFHSVSHPLKSPPELRPRPTLQRARGRENAGGGHKSQGSDLSTPPLHRAQARAQRGGRRRVSPMGRESPLPRPLGCAGPAPACGGQCPQRKRNSEGGKHRPTARPRPGSCLLSRGPGPLRGGARLPAIPARPRFSSGVGLSSHQQKRRQHLLALRGGPGRAGGRVPAEQRPPCGGRQHKAQGPTSAPRPRVLSDGTLKMLLKGEKCLSVPRGPRGPLRAPGTEPTAARLLPPRKDAGPPPAPRLPQQTTGGRRPHLGPLDGERGSSMRAPDHGGPHAPQSDTQRVTCGGQ